MSIAVRVVRGLMLNGKAHAAGETLHLSPADAAAVLVTARAKLVNESDLPAVIAGQRAERDKTMALAGRPPAEPLRFGFSRKAA